MSPPQEQSLLYPILPLDNSPSPAEQTVLADAVRYPPSLYLSAVKQQSTHIADTAVNRSALVQWDVILLFITQRHQAQ
jgi:hypothetical protein